MWRLKGQFWGGVKYYYTPKLYVHVGSMFNRIGTVLLSLIPFNILILRRLVVVQKKSNQKKEREKEKMKKKKK